MRMDVHFSYNDMRFNADMGKILVLNGGGTMSFGPEHAGSLLYIGQDGSVLPLSLGAGLAIIGGVLTITNAQTMHAVCGTVLAGQVKCGEV